MITPELISYIRGELAKGRAREEIRKSLVVEGGWSETDLSEAFRTVIPMQGFGESAVSEKPKPSTASSVSPAISPSIFAPSLSSVSSSHSLSAFPWKKISLIVVIVLIIGALGFGGWFYRASLMNFWNGGVAKVSGFFSSLFGPKETTKNTAQVTPLIPSPPINTPPLVVTVKDCGASVAPDLKKSASYQNNAVLACLGSSALNCQPATAILNDPLFPTIVRIVKNMDNCNFKLSYADQSTLVDATGVKLAGQYISCPIFSVKAVDESQKTPSFSAPSADNLSKYAAQIYFYGTLGVFMETNLDQNKIQSLGCSGSYIDSVIASYRKMQSGR